MNVQKDTDELDKTLAGIVLLFCFLSFHSLILSKNSSANVVVPCETLTHGSTLLYFPHFRAKLAVHKQPLSIRQLHSQ